MAKQTRRTPAQVVAKAAVRSTLDVDTLRDVVHLLEASAVTSLVWSNGVEKLVIRRGEDAAPSQSHLKTHQAFESEGVRTAPRLSAPRPVSATQTSEGEKQGHIISSPFVGTFYRSPAPDQPSFTDLGSIVKKGQVLCIVEAMKLMNEIESEVSGRVAEILAQNTQPVEFGQALFRIEPA